MDVIGFVGGGNMAEALIKGVVKAGVYLPENVIVSDIRAERLKYLAEKYGVVPAESNADLAAKVQTVVLSVKPQNMAEALESIKDAMNPASCVMRDALCVTNDAIRNTHTELVISIAAGIRVASIAAVLGEVPVIRVMPNTPALIGEGASALFANKKATILIGRAMAIFSAVGKAVVVEDEDLIDAVTAVSGSGPAYFFLLMEEMIKAGTALGLPETVAKDLVLQTARGAGLLAFEAGKSGESPADLRRKVTSPGGTTEAAIKVFEEGRIGALISAALTRARDRGKELSK